MKLVVVLILACASIFADKLVIEWSISPNRTACFAQKIVGKEVTFVGLEWPEFVKKYEYCYIRRWFGWSKIKTAKMDETGWNFPHGGNAQWPLHSPPYRRDLGGLIIITPTISGEPTQK